MDLLSKFGIDSKLISDKGVIVTPESAGRILLLDGDPLCYQSVNNVMKLDTAFNRFQEKILSIMYQTKCQTARVHLTPRGSLKNGRHSLKTVKPYQGNRVGVQKSPLLEPLRTGAANHFRGHPDFIILPQYEFEADDGLVIDAYSLLNTCLCSIDKDLNLSPYEDYSTTEGKFRKLLDGDTFGYIKERKWVTDSGNARSAVTGKGTKFFFAQLLMGDTADNIQGIISYNGKTVGKARAFKLLEHINDESECADFVIKAYSSIHQNVIPEAEALWMLRSIDDSAYKYLSTLDLTLQARSYLNACYNQEWRND